MSFCKDGGGGGSAAKPFESLYVIQKNGCWIWIGAKGPCRGMVYGVRMVDGKHKKAHTLSYERANGPVPKGMELDHLCKNTLCINPLHLEPVPHRINVLRGNSPAAKNAKKTNAPCGHPYSGRDSRVRYCKPCRTKWHREYYHRNKAEILSRQKEYRHAV